jgi:histidyl-tRNA synthetase
MSKQAISTDPYKGVRDFYPEDQFIQRYIFETMHEVCELYGFEEYNASILEPAELYRSKNAENAEIVNEQTYTFTDRGGREVTLRPEMTPTVARMVAARRRDLPFPLRLYSIPNCFRYERPQRGRLREHWQLNADIFGVPGIEAEVEIIMLAHRTMLGLGATESMFEIRVSDRRFMDEIYSALGINETDGRTVTRILDRRGKEDIEPKLAEVLGAEKAATLARTLKEVQSTAHLEDIMSRLTALGITNVTVDTSIVRGFDYYTGMVFEVFDTDPENRRSLFGGGRYDNLLALFGQEPLSAVGFGMGDVTARDFLETHKLLPAYNPATELMLCVAEDAAMPHAMLLAEQLRGEDVTVAINYSGKRIGDQLRHADKLGIPNIIVVGEKEIANDLYTIKNLASGEEHSVKAAHIADHMLSAQG